MRTALDMATDDLKGARERARRQRKTTGEVISEPARRALTTPSPAPKAAEPKAVHGFRPFPKRGGIVTHGLIATLREVDAS